MEQTRAAIQSDWRTCPLPSKRAEIIVGRRFSREEMISIRRGAVPSQMEDKWFIYWKDEQLFFHRSWTGACIYVVRFELDVKGARMVSVLVNRDMDQYGGTDPSKEAALVSLIIDIVLLNSVTNSVDPY